MGTVITRERITRVIKIAGGILTVISLLWALIEGSQWIFGKFIEPKAYLFDKAPESYKNIYLCRRNNDNSTDYAKKFAWILWDYYSYPDSWVMQSNGKNYHRGMSVTPDSSQNAEIYYRLNAEYDSLSGKIAFEDKDFGRTDQTYCINFYTDGRKQIGNYTIRKGHAPISVNLDLHGCEQLIIEFVRPVGDGSDDPNINLLEFALR